MIPAGTYCMRRDANVISGELIVGIYIDVCYGKPLRVYIPSGCVPDPGKYEFLCSPGQLRNIADDLLKLADAFEGK